MDESNKNLANAKAVADWMNAHPDYNDSELCSVIAEHDMQVWKKQGFDEPCCYNDDYVVVKASKGYVCEDIDLYAEDRLRYEC